MELGSIWRTILLISVTAASPKSHICIYHFEILIQYFSVLFFHFSPVTVSDMFMFPHIVKSFISVFHWCSVFCSVLLLIVFALWSVVIVLTTADSPVTSCWGFSPILFSKLKMRFLLSDFFEASAKVLHRSTFSRKSFAKVPNFKAYNCSLNHTLVW